MIKKIIFLIFVLFPLSVAATPYDIDSLLHELDITVANAAHYRELHEMKIANARKELSRSASKQEQLNQLRNLCNFFFLYQNDSALAYNERSIQLAQELDEPTFYITFTCQKALLLGHAGLPTFAFEILDSLLLDPRSNTPELKKTIYQSYLDINDFVYHYNMPGMLLTQNAKFIASMRDSFYHYCSEESEQAIHTYPATTSTKEMIEQMRKRLREADNDQQRGVLCMVISNLYRSEAMPEMREAYLIMAAIYNIRTARMDNEALISISKILINEEDWERAEAYLTLAEWQAIHYGSRSREVQLSPLLQKLHEHQNQRYHHWKAVGWAGILISLLFLMCFSIYGYFTRKNRRKLEQEIECHNEYKAQIVQKEQATLTQVEAQADALTHFMSIATDAIFEFVHLRQLVIRRLKNNDVSALLKQLSNDNSTSKTQTELLRKFDIAFLRLYPDFIAKINALMLPEAQISKPEDELMSTELRLLALWRLEITEAGRVATILNLSVNTIYFYRNKLRNGAKDRTHFNEDIMKIKGV